MPTYPDVHASWLTATKLQPPRLRQDVIPRQQLLAALHDAVVSHPLTLVSAPAGYGKTTLLAALLKAYPDPVTAWLSLDQEDNEPARFLTAVAAALQRAIPPCGARVQALLASSPNPGAEVRRVTGVLVNDILETAPGDCALIVEDLHTITEPSVYVALDYLLERLPPQMHLVVSARHDPPLALARLRARGHLAEKRLSHLRFTFDETSAFLNDQLDLHLTDHDLARLHAGTEGWPAGLRLLANSLGQIPGSAGRTAFIANLNQANTYVFDFLADEVLARQKEKVRNFLLETSILSELDPKLCQAVTGQSDTAAALEEIYRQNLFLVAADDAGTTYRYHHLFAEFLQARLEREMPDRIPELHRRAGEAEPVPARAIAHYLAAQLWEPAAKAMERAGEQLLGDGLLRTLRGWIESLPVSVLDAHPRLVYFLGACALQSGDLERASSLLERARTAFQIAGDRAGEGDALQELVGVVSQQHDYGRQSTLIDQALACPLPVHGRVQLLIARTWQSVYEGDRDKADADLDEALRVTLESGNLRAFNVMAPILRAHLALLPGGTGRMEHYCRQALDRFGEAPGVVRAGAHCMLGYIYSLRGHIDEALREAERARVISQSLGGFHYLDWEIDIVLTSAYLMRGDYARSERHWQERLPWYEQISAIKPWMPTFLYYIGRAQWMQGNLEQARKTEARLSSMTDERVFPELAVSRALMRAIIEISDRRYTEAEQTLRPAVELEQKNRHCLVFGNARLLLAYLHLLRERPQQALSELSLFLAECETAGVPGLVLREGAVIMTPLLRLAMERGAHASFAARLLDLLGGTAELHRVHVSDTGETLTAREVEILRLIAQGASNRAITEQLIITERTVKTHVTSILRKLNAQSRTHAAARARDLRIV